MPNNSRAISFTKYPSGVRIRHSNAIKVIHCLFVTIVVTFTVTRPIPVQPLLFLPIPVRHRLTDHGLLSIIAKTALRNSHRFIELQTPHFVNSSDSDTCKLPGGIGPNSLQTVRIISRPAIAPSIGRRVRMTQNSASRATKNVGLGGIPTARPTAMKRRREYKTMPLRKTTSSPSQRFLFWTSQRTALYIKLLFGCRCLLHGFAHTTSGLAAVFAASGTFSGVNSNFRALEFCGANSTNEG